MDLARRIYNRELKVAAMRELDSGRTIGELARQLELSPKLLESWRGEWRARGELAFPGSGRRGPSQGFTQLQRTAELERKTVCSMPVGPTRTCSNSTRSPSA